MRHTETGNGDPCPVDETHGRMWFTSADRQWCPSARHRGFAIYLRDGVTPATPQSGQETRSHAPGLSTAPSTPVSFGEGLAAP